MLVLISFFLRVYFFFNDFSKINYPRIHWTDSDKHRMKAFSLQMNDLTSFSDMSRDVAMATNFVKKIGKLRTFVALAFKNGLG